jgi:hypothetical protein
MDVGVEELKVMRQIRKDVPRTANDIAIVLHPRAQLLLERTLYVWAVRHPASGYVQGMNDLFLPFFFVAVGERLQLAAHASDAASAASAAGDVDATGDGADDESDDDAAVSAFLGWTHEEMERRVAAELPEAAWLEIEADVFWLASTFMSSVQDNFTFTQNGTHGMVQQLHRVMLAVNAPVVAHLDAMNICFAEFAFRWMNCFLLRELTPRQATRLWDTYICEGHDFAQFHVFVCAAVLQRVADAVQASDDFAVVMGLLQAPPIDALSEREVGELCAAAFVLQQQYGRDGAAPK